MILTHFCQPWRYNVPRMWHFVVAQAHSTAVSGPIILLCGFQYSKQSGPQGKLNLKLRVTFSVGSFVSHVQVRSSFVFEKCVVTISRESQSSQQIGAHPSGLQRLQGTLQYSRYRVPYSRYRLWLQGTLCNRIRISATGLLGQPRLRPELVL